MSVKSKIKQSSNTQINPYEGRYGLVYARVSSKRQEIEGHGRESQESRCRADLESIGVPVEKVFPDTASGGGDFMKRQAMKALLAYVDANPHKKYVVNFDDLKRFARDTAFHLKLRTELKMRDVLPRCLNYNFDDSPEGMFVETVLAAGNELERHQNARQVVQKQMARMMVGYWPFPAVRPFEMKEHPLHGKILTAVHPDTQYVKEALEAFADGVFVRKIDACKFLLEKGYWKGKNPEKYIDAFTALAKSILNVGWVGYEKWGVKPIQGKHEGFISLETYERLQKRLRREGLSTRIRRDIRDDLPLRGLTLCAGCDEPLTGASSTGRTKKYPYYVCHTKECKYYGKSIKPEVMEHRFHHLLAEQKLKDDVDPLVKLTFDRVYKEEVVTAKTQEAIVTSHRSSLEEQARKLTEAIFGAKDPAVKKVYESQLERVAHELENPDLNEAEMDFSVPYRTALEKSTALLKSPLKYWVSLDVREQHRLFFFIFEEKLQYDLENGYRTTELPRAATLFETFAVQSSTDVDLPGIEPGTRQCECRVMPLYYKPERWVSTKYKPAIRG